MSNSTLETFDRHALVLALWLSFGLTAAACFHIGLGIGGWPWIAGGFTLVIAGFIAQVIVHVVFRSRFTEKEVALGLVLFGSALLIYVLSLLFSEPFQTHAVPVGLGFVATAAAVLLTLIIWLGIRGAFASFDIIRRFKQR